MSLSFKEFNSMHADIRRIVEEEVQAELKLEEGLFGGIFSSGSKNNTASSQSKLDQANQDKKISDEYATYVKHNPKATISLQQYKALRTKMKDDAWKAAKHNANSVAKSAADKSERSKNANDRGEEYAGSFTYSQPKFH